MLRHNVLLETDPHRNLSFGRQYLSISINLAHFGNGCYPSGAHITVICLTIECDWARAVSAPCLVQQGGVQGAWKSKRGIKRGAV